MANLAEFYIDASPPSVRGFDADTSGTHELRLAVSSSMVRTVTYHVRPAVPVATSPRATLGAAVLTLDNGVTTGQAVPATTPTAIVEVSGFPAVNTTAHLWEVLCLVNGGFNDRGVPDPDYRFSRFVAIRNEALLRKIMAFERNEYDPIESWAKAVNDLIDAAFGGSGGATNSDLVVNASDVDGASVSDALETLAEAIADVEAGAIGDHGALTGRGDDDHEQYLLVTGARAMGGDFNVGGHAITNVGLVDGVNLPAHAARHQPGGADALATGVPVAIGAELSAGTGTALALATHVHTHGAQLGGSLHALATTVAAGFLSAAGFTAITDSATHIAITSGNPHGTSFTNLVGGTLAQLNTLVTDFDLVPTTRSVIAGNGLTGGGALSGDVTITVAPANTTITVTANAIAVGIITAANVAVGTLSVNRLVPGSVGQFIGVSDGAAAWVSRSADDYDDYLLLTGARAMEGALNMGTYAITNVGLVDGVDVSDHSARHQPGGADAIPTATTVAVGTAAAVGTSTSLSRADHVHAHGDQTVGTLHAVASATVAGFMPTAMWSTVNALPATSASAATTITAGAGLSGGGTLAANRTFAVGANADGSIVVNADDIQVGVISNANITDGTIAVDKLDPGTTNYVVATNAAGTDVTWTRLTSAHLSNSAAIAATQLAAGGANTVLWSNGTANTFSGSPTLTSLVATSFLSVGSGAASSGAIRLGPTDGIVCASLDGLSYSNLIGRNSAGDATVGGIAADPGGDSGVTLICGATRVSARVSRDGTMSNVVSITGTSATFNYGARDTVITDGDVRSYGFTAQSDGTVPDAPSNGQRLFSNGSELVARNVAGSYWELSPDDENSNYPSVRFVKTGVRRAFTTNQTVTLALTELIPYLTATTGLIATFTIEVTSVFRSPTIGSHCRKRGGTMIVTYNGTQWGVDILTPTSPAIGDSEDGKFRVIYENSSLVQLTWNASSYYSSSPSLRFTLQAAGTTTTWFQIVVSGPGISI